jgi:CubicO group peptidase (beta-lactamase class C family)
VETITGQRVEDFVRERVWKPIGMSTTFYSMTDSLRSRCAPTSTKSDGTPVQGEIHDPLANYHGTSAHCPGNAGLFSTAMDLANYAEMILNGGERNGKRVFKTETVRNMTTIHTPTGVDSLRGLGWDVYETKPYVTPLNNSPETLVIGHTGYTGTLLVLDKLSKTYVVFLTNRVFPSPATGGKEGETIDPIRRQICDTVLRSLACYREVFQ